MGYVLHDTLEKQTSLLSVGNRVSSWKTLLLFVILANLPDLDFLPGFLLGEPNRFHHHYWSHSLGAAVVVGCLTALIFCGRDRGRFVWQMLLFSGIYFSHVALDTLSSDLKEPFGVPMFWPFSEAYIVSPVLIFMSIQKVDTSGGFIPSLLTAHNLWAAAWEFLVFAPVVSIMKLMQLRRRRLQPVCEK